MYKEILFCAFLSLPLCIVVYNFLPTFYVSLFYSKDKWIKKDINTDRFDKIISCIPLFDRLRNRTRTRLEEAAVGDEKTELIWMGFTFLMPVIIFLFNISSGNGLIQSVCVAVIIGVLPEIWLSGRITERKSVFTKNTYKIYSFLHTQISAGIKPTDAIKGMCEIVGHKLIKETFISFTARFELTLDIDESLQILRRSFRGYDGEMLCVCIKQCIATGTAGRTLLKMEELMFSKFFNITQRETEKYRTKLLISGLIGLVPVIMILCLPVVYEAISGLLTMLEL